MQKVRERTVKKTAKTVAEKKEVVEKREVVEMVVCSSVAWVELFD